MSKNQNKETEGKQGGIAYSGIVEVTHLCDVQKFWELFVMSEKSQYFLRESIFQRGILGYPL